MTTRKIPFQAKFSSRAALAVACGLCAALSAVACAQEPNCEELDDCGGPMPVGEWRLGAGHVSCSEDLYRPATDTRLLGGEIPPARVQTIEPALYDWCNLLLTGQSAGKDVVLKAPIFYIESPEVGSSVVTYTPDPGGPDTGLFTTSVTYTGRYVMDLPEVCVRGFGAKDQVDLDSDPNGGVVQLCDRIQVKIGEAGIGQGSFPNTDCYPNPEEPGGCLCVFDATETGGPSGVYRREGKSITHFTSGGYPSRANYCNQGNRLLLTGADGSYLFNVSGLRTMDLGPSATTPTPFPPAPAAAP